MSSGCCGWGYSSWNCGWHSTTVVYHGGAYYGNAPGTAATTDQAASRTMAPDITRPLGPMRVALRFQTDTALQAPVRRITHPPGLMRVALQPRTHTAAQARPRRTTQGPGPLPPQCKAPMPMEAGEARQFRRTAPPRTASIKRPRKELQDPCKHPNGASAYGASGKNGNSAAVGQTANGNKYASANGNTYKNTGSGWTGNSNNTPKSGSSYSGQSASAKGWGGQEKSSGSSAFGGASGGGWDSRSASARGSVQQRRWRRLGRTQRWRRFSQVSLCARVQMQPGSVPDWPSVKTVDVLEDSYVGPNQQSRGRQSDAASGSDHSPYRVQQVRNRRRKLLRPQRMQAMRCCKRQSQEIKTRCWHLRAEVEGTHLLRRCRAGQGCDRRICCGL